MMDDTLLTAFGFPRPPALLRRLVEGALKGKARIVRRLPGRRRPRMRTEMKHRTYPEGYRIEELGPQEPAHSSPYLRSRRSTPKRIDVPRLTSAQLATEKVANGEV